jgi:pyruvate dehydrogenase E2 component (dihydrolipoamide acetyltransferase)
VTVLVDVGMPRLSDSMEEATILRWLKREGDAVARGEELVEVETDKATMVYEAEADGVLEEIVVDDGGTAALGAVIARMRATGRAPSPAEPPSAPSGTRARATPVARKLAAQLGVALDGMNGSGPGGRIVGADVRSVAGDAPSAVAPSEGRGAVEELPLTSTQRTIAQRMSESRATVPEFTLEAEIDMTAAAQVREDLRAASVEPLPSYNDLVVRAAALTLRELPGMNAAWGGDRILRFGRVNVGVAVATDDALIVPTIFDADRKTVAEIAIESRRLASAARSRRIAPAELADGTFTVSNLGMFGIRRFHAVINVPQAAILAVGEVARRPAVAEDGSVVGRLLMDVALSCDHRVVYGADAARFLQRLRELLESHPTRLVIA